MKGFIVYATYTTDGGRTYVQLFGRLENGQSFMTVSEFEPYMYIEKKHMKKIPRLKEDYKVDESELRTFGGEGVVKISAPTLPILNNLHKAINKTVRTYEADIRPQYRFIFDNGLLGSLNIEGEYVSSDKIDRIYHNPEISSAEFQPELKMVSIDTESGGDGELYCIGVSSGKYRKNFLVTDSKMKLKDAVNCATVDECLEKFKEEIAKLDPDVIVGWNVIDFDFPYLRGLFKKNKVRFDIGRSDSEPKIRVESNFFRASSVDLEGRQVLDGLNLVKDPFIKEAPSIKSANFDSFSLEDVAQALIKKGKLLKGKGRHEEIESLYKTHSKDSLQKLVDYNLRDCELVYEILTENKMVDLAVERSQLTGLPLDRLTASIASFDSLYIREANKRGLVSPTSMYGKKEERIKGGYVQDVKAGIYHNVLVLDFKSLYPSIIKTFNIDPASMLERKKKGAVESPNKAYFENTDGILPEIIGRLHEAREKAKKEKRELSSYAIKIIMNSFFGVLASPNCRYFNLDMANAITHFGQHIIKLTAKEVEKKFGVKTIYSDTDSIFVSSEREKSKAEVLGKEVQDYVNEFYRKHVKDEYSRTSYLELEYEKLYLSMMLPRIRHSTAGAKKRYAGLIEKGGKEELQIIGLEAIRGDWTPAAQDFQRELLTKVFHKEDPVKFIKNYIKKIEQGKLDDKLVYKKSIRKNLDEYTKTTPPHVKAARKLDSLDSNVIRYYITEDGPEPVQKLKSKLDYKHYVDKQIKPIANQVLVLFDKDFDEILQNSKQAKLFS